jgi:heme exporter protein D
MGKYAAYIWSAYGLAAFVLCINVLAPLLRRKNVRRRLKEFYRLERQAR